MPISTNPNTGESVYLDGDGSWQPAKTAVNPQTREMMAYDGKDWQKVTMHGQGILSYVDDAVRAIASGITFGYADTIAAKMDELTGRGGSYEKNLQTQRARTAEEPAGIRIPGEIAGAVAGTVAAAPVTGPLAAASGVARLPAAVRAIAGGAAAGGAFASGEAEPGERLAAVPGGAAVGALTGGALAGVGSATRGILAPRAAAIADLTRAIQRDTMTPQGLESAVQTVSRERPGAIIADVGGENVRGLLERVAQTPGAGRTTVIPFLTDRQTQQAARLSQDLSDLTGTRRSAFQAVTETMADMKQAAQPLYQAAYEAGDRAVWSPELERLSSSPTVKSAMQGAVRTWRDVAVADGFGGMNPGAMVERGGQLEFLSGRVPVFPNLQFWDYTKRIIDDKISTAVRAGQTQKVRTLTALNTALRNDLDRQVPQYRSARDAWSGPSSYLDAIEDGRNILSRNVSAEEVAANFTGLSAAQQAGYREGAVSAVVGKMGGDPAKLGDLTKYLRSPAMREKISAILPTPQARQAWRRRLDFEVRSSELVNQSLRNSATYRRLQEAQDAQNLVSDLAVHTFSGGANTHNILTKIIVGGVKRARDTFRSRADRELASILTGRTVPQAPRTPTRRVLGQSSLFPATVGATAGLIEQ